MATGSGGRAADAWRQEQDGRCMVAGAGAGQGGQAQGTAGDAAAALGANKVDGLLYLNRT